MNILFINCCIRGKDISRTDKLARCLIETACAENDSLIEEDLANGQLFMPMFKKDIDNRTKLIEKSDYSNKEFDAAKRLANADVVIIAAPFWDLSFPSELKCYIEHITVNGITFKYSESGIPQGLCKAKKLYYVTTAGGYIYNDSFSFGYIKELFCGMFGIKDIELIKAEGLDILENNSEKILVEVENKIRTKCYN